MNRRGYHKNMTREEMEEKFAAFGNLPRGFVQCGGQNAEDPGCHRIVRLEHVDDDGFCVFCQDQGEEPDSEAQSPDGESQPDVSETSVTEAESSASGE